MARPVTTPPFLTPILALAMLATAVGAARADEAAVDAITRGASDIASPGVPGSVIPVAADAFPVVQGRNGRYMEAVVAAVQRGDTRAVAFGHEGYLNSLDPGTLTVLANAGQWAAKERPNARLGVWRLDPLRQALADKGLNVAPVSDLGQIRGFDAVYVNAHQITPEQAGQLRRYLEDGGGVVTSGLGWGWQQLNPGRPLTDFPGNLMLAPVGLVFTGSYLEPTGEGRMKTEPRPGPLLGASLALAALAKNDDPNAAAQAGWTVSQAVNSLPADDRFLRPELSRLEREHGGLVVVGPDRPLKATSALDRLLVTLQTRRLLDAPGDQPTKHPAAALFPGAVPADAERSNVRVVVTSPQRGWFSTGLYVPPGEAVTLRPDPAALAANLSVVIGCHTDTLWHLDEWRRMPEITRRFALDKPEVTVSSPFGGLLYFDVPRPNSAGRPSVRVTGAVRAPLFRLGQTDPAAWRERIRAYPGPWAELATDKIVITVPSSGVQNLDDPTELLKFWDRVADACADLAGWPRQRERADRMVADEQISAGYMHAGYPIMTWLDVVPLVTSLEKLTAEGSWGHFHELGHNHQNGDWTFDGTVEVTVNLFTQYVYDTVLGARPAGRAFTPEDCLKRFRAFRDAGARFDQWKGDPFLALTMYMQLQHAFGWDAYKALFKTYLALPHGERPRNDAEKRDQWMERFSRQVGRNLGPFFQAWGVPTSASAQARVADLPPWMPEGMTP